MGNLELTPAQVQQAKLAGIPADRPGLMGEYPRMLYKLGRRDEQSYLGNVDGEFLTWGKKVETKVVEDREEEVEALSEGWVRSLEGDATDDVADPRDLAIAELQAQLAQANMRNAMGDAGFEPLPKRGPGRPPKEQNPDS